MIGIQTWLLAAVLAAVSVRLGSADTAAAAPSSSVLQRPTDADAVVEQASGSTLTSGMSLVQVRQQAPACNAGIPGGSCSLDM